jgi:hypothetical protein
MEIRCGPGRTQTLLLTEGPNNIPTEEDRFRKIEDDHITSICNDRNICKQLNPSAIFLSESSRPKKCFILA